MKYAFTPLAAAIGLSVIPSSSFAQGNIALEEIIVTATKKLETVQDTPIALNAYDESTIQQASINDTNDLAILTPSLTAKTNTSAFATTISIRGIGTPQTDPALEPSVGFFIDGVYMGRSGLGMSDLTDIERIEVLQGPQGTLYGKNTNAGAISVFTKGPNEDFFEGYVEGTVGNYSQEKITFAATGPISDSVAYRLSGNMHERDGYIENSGGDDMNGADDWNMMGKLLWQVNDEISVLLSASHIERDTDCCGPDSTQTDVVNNTLVSQGFAPDKNDPFDRKTGNDAETTFELESDNVALTIDAEYDWGEIKSITAWNDYSYASGSDVDRSQLDVLTLPESDNGGDSLSQEFRFSSEAMDGELEYQVGLFYYESTTTQGEGDIFVETGTDFVPIGVQIIGPQIGFAAAAGDTITVDHEWETETIAVFSQATWYIGDSWRLTGGLRWTEEEKDADLFSVVDSTAPSVGIIGTSFLESFMTPVDADFNRSTENVNWMVNASYDITEDIMLYASAATGTKSGGFNGANGAEAEREFDDEDTLNMEVGIKSSILDNRVRINATAFLTEIEEYQDQKQQDSGAGTVTANEGEVEVSGIDFSVDAQALKNLRLSMGLLYLDKYEITDGPNKGRELGYAAEVSGNLSATLMLPFADGGAYLRGDYSFQGDHITGDRNSSQSYQDMQSFNAKLGWANDSWDLSIWGKNLTDEDYAVFTAAPFPVSGVEAYWLAPPRTYGATVRYSFGE